MVEQMLNRLNRANRTAVFLVTALVCVVVLLIGGWPAAIGLLAFAAVVATLTALRWNGSTARERVMRLAVLALLVTLAMLMIR